jgi:predicted PurR-regulated permease PerM
MSSAVMARIGRIALALGVLVVLVWLALRLHSIITAFAVAFVIAYVLNPMANALERLYSRLFARVRFLGPRGLAVGTLCIAVVLALVAVCVFVVPAVYQQVAETVVKLPSYAETLRTRIEPTVQRFNLRYPVVYEELRRRVAETVRNHLPEIVAPLTHVIGAAFSSGLSLVLSVLNLIIVPVFAVYLLYDMNRITAGLAELVPHRYRAYVYSRARAVDGLLSAFVRGQLTVCLMLGAFYAIALSACGVPMGGAVGLIVGFFNLIPYMSTALGLPLTLLLSWVDDQSWQALVAVTVVYFFGQIVEGNIVTPRIVGGRLGLHSIVVVLAVLVGGTLFGFVGMLIAVPTTAALSVFWEDLRSWYLGSSLYQGGAPPAGPPAAA